VVEEEEEEEEVCVCGGVEKEGVGGIGGGGVDVGKTACPGVWTCQTGHPTRDRHTGSERTQYGGCADARTPRPLPASLGRTTHAALLSAPLSPPPPPPVAMWAVSSPPSPPR
jgi:hypothetical protein